MRARILRPPSGMWQGWDLRAPGCPGSALGAYRRSACGPGIPIVPIQYRYWTVSSRPLVVVKLKLLWLFASTNPNWINSFDPRSAC